MGSRPQNNLCSPHKMALRHVYFPDLSNVSSRGNNQIDENCDETKKRAVNSKTVRA